MLDAWIIVPLEEYDWIIPMIMKPKNTKEICIFVNLRSLNASCVHDPFPTSFMEEVLENVGG
jgi:hypothetical protein